MVRTSNRFRYTLIFCSIVIILLFIFSLLYSTWTSSKLQLNQNYSESDGPVDSSSNTYRFAPDEIAKAYEHFSELVAPEYIPESFELAELKIQDLDDYYSAQYLYQKEDRENEWDVLGIAIINNKDESMFQGANFFNIADGVEFGGGYILYHKDPDTDIISASKVWNTGQYVFVTGAISQDELDLILDGVPFPY